MRKIMARRSGAITTPIATSLVSTPQCLGQKKVPAQGDDPRVAAGPRVRSKQDFGLSRMSSLARLIAMLVVATLALTANGNAAPITYKLIIIGAPYAPGPSGSLGGVSFGGPNNPVALVFTFESDTANVVSWLTTGPVAAGFENATGTASVQVTDPAGAVLAQANFLPSAGIFVSVDNTNGGIGFGSFAVTDQNSPSFPGQPLYPYGMIGGPVATVDLRSNTALAFVLGFPQFGASCAGFPLTCSSSLALPTDGGELLVDSMIPGTPGAPNALFLIQTHSGASGPLTTFTNFNASGEFIPPFLLLNGGFLLGDLGVINPSTEAVTLQIGSFLVTVPKGSFQQTSPGTFLFAGNLGGVFLSVQIVDQGSGSYTFNVITAGASFGTANPAPVSLNFGAEMGGTSVPFVVF
jgi:hypothetical protein